MDTIKLITCKGCGLVYNMDYLRFYIEYNDDGSVDESTACWDGDRYVPYVLCNVCQHMIKGGDHA